MKGRYRLLVSFPVGDVVGHYGAEEKQLHDLAETLGGFKDRVFDMYLEFSLLADKGMLIRQEYGTCRGNMTVSFYYPPTVSVDERRQQIINILLKKYLHEPVYPRPGIYVVQDKDENYRLLKTSNEHVISSSYNSSNNTVSKYLH